MTDTHDPRWYLSPRAESVWQWREEGQVLTWNSGATIAFREELQAVLNSMALHGLPAFTPLLLVLAATRDNWRENSFALSKELGFQAKANSNDNRIELIVQVLQGLDRLQALPEDLRRTPAAKAAICQFVFQDAPREVPPSGTREVLETLAGGIPEDIYAPLRAVNVSPKALADELYALVRGLQRISAETLRLHKQTGLEELPQPIETPIDPSELVRSLLKQLEQDDELSGLAKLAKNLMAAVTLPRALADREEMPLGGVSDLTNRGQLDQLLLSELAHDDLTLAVRVAENEALYLRRETPPRQPPQDRCVLLDASIRTWGIPRVFITAVALALAATTDRHTRVVAFRARGYDFEPVDLTTREGLIEHLAALEPELHPGEALPSFQNQFAQLEYAAEPVLITTDETLADVDFLRQVATSGIAPLHVAAVSRGGTFRLVERTPRGTRLVREAQLELESLFKQPESTVPSLIERKVEAGLPAIFGVWPFPLRCSHSPTPSGMWPLKGRGMLAITRDRQLMLWDRAERGGRLLADCLPSSRLHWAMFDEANDLLFLLVGELQRGDLSLVQIGMESGEPRVTPLNLPQEPLQGVSHLGSVLLAIGQTHVEVLGLPEGEHRERLKLPLGVVWSRDRFFRDAHHAWFAATYQGERLIFEPVLTDRDRDCPPLGELFVRQGHEGYWGVTQAGDIYSTDEQRLYKVSHLPPGNRSALAIAKDGSRLVMLDDVAFNMNRRERTVIDVETMTAQPLKQDAQQAVQPERSNFHPLNLRHKIGRIGRTRAGELLLVTRKQLLVLDFSDYHRGMRLMPVHEKEIESRSLMTFKQTQFLGDRGYKLTLATWDDGSQAFLDSRGMLHLRSANLSIPEATLVLYEKHVSAWCADGHICGMPYFGGIAKRNTSRHIFEKVISPFVAHLP